MMSVDPHAKVRSLAGLNAINFFQAEMVGVVLPVMGVFLREAHWRYDAIGGATAVAGLGTLLFQAPAGALTDRISSRRLLFAVTAILTGICFACIPMVPILLSGLMACCLLQELRRVFWLPCLVLSRWDWLGMNC